MAINSPFGSTIPLSTVYVPGYGPSVPWPTTAAEATALFNSLAASGYTAVMVDPNVGEATGTSPCDVDLNGLKWVVDLTEYWKSPDEVQAGVTKANSSQNRINIIGYHLQSEVTTPAQATALATLASQIDPFGNMPIWIGLRPQGSAFVIDDAVVQALAHVKDGVIGFWLDASHEPGKPNVACLNTLTKNLATGNALLYAGYWLSYENHTYRFPYIAADLNVATAYGVTAIFWWVPKSSPANSLNAFNFQTQSIWAELLGSYFQTTVAVTNEIAVPINPISFVTLNPSANAKLYVGSFETTDAAATFFFVANADVHNAAALTLTPDSAYQIWQFTANTTSVGGTWTPLGSEPTISIPMSSGVLLKFVSSSSGSKSTTP